jgi:chromosome segregation ATPase
VERIRRLIQQKHEKYTGELIKLEKEQEKRSNEIKENQKEFEDVENTIAVSGGDKARELQDQLDKTRVAHALAERNAEKAREELELLESGRKILNEDYKESSKDLKKLTQDLDKATKKVKKLESQISAKVTRLSELEGAAANNSEAVTTQRDELESLRKDAGELEMQKHRLEGEKEQLEIQLTSAEEQIVRSKQWLESVEIDAKEADFQLKDLEVGNESASKNLDNIKTKHNNVLRTIESHQKRLSELETKLRNDSMQLASQEAAQRAREEFGGYTKGVKGLLQCRDERTLKGIIGTVAYFSSTLPNSAIVPIMPFNVLSSRHCKSALTPFVYPPNSSLALCAASCEANCIESFLSLVSSSDNLF